MQLSTRIQNMTQINNGWAVLYLAREMIAAGQSVVQLTIGEHDIRTDPAILDAMEASARAGNTGYCSVRGALALRQAIADRAMRLNMGATDPSQIQLTPGGQGALQSLMMAVANPGDGVLIIDPYYATYIGTALSASLEPLIVTARSRDGFQPQRAAFDAAIADAVARGITPAAILINSPNNPTGAVYSAATLNMIADVAIQHDLWVISDEVYDSQNWSGPHRSIRTLPDMMARTVIVGSMSKSHAMTGSRAGWAIAPKDVAHGLEQLALATTYGLPGFVQDAALAALDMGPEFETQIAAPFRRRRGVVLDALARLVPDVDGADGPRPLFPHIPADGAMYLMLDLRATGLSGHDFAMGLLRDRGIAVMPGESFGQAAAGHIRIALTLPDDQLRDALAVVIAYAREKAGA